MRNIPVGAKREEKIDVTEDVAINFLGPREGRVLSTPELIMFLEMTCRNLIKGLVDPDEDSVGTHVDVRHFAATPVGMQARFYAEIVSVEDRRIRMKVEAFDEVEKVAEGTHERFVVNVSRFASKVQAKAAALQRPIRQGSVLNET